MTDQQLTGFVELWACPRGDAAFAIQLGALAEYGDHAQRQAVSAQLAHRERFPDHFDTGYAVPR